MEKSKLNGLFFNKNYVNILCLIFVFYLIAYFSIIFIYSVNFPLYDDYTAILASVFRLKHSTSFHDFITILLKQHNEHRIGFTRLIAYLSTFFTQKINLRFLSFFGDLALPIITFYLYKLFRNNTNSGNSFYFLPVVFIIFNLQLYSNLFWPMSGIQNFWVYVWGISFLYCVFYKQQGLTFISLLPLTLAVYTSGNGFFLVPVAVFMLFLLQKNKSAWLLLSIGVVFLGLYLYDFQKKNYVPDNQNLIEIAERNFQFLGMFLGAFFYHPNVKWLSILMGWLVVLFFCYLFFKKYYLENPTLFAFYGFLILTSVIVSISRSKLGVEFAAASRYRISSLLALSCFYLTWIDSVKTNKYVIWASIVSLFVFNSYINYFYFLKVIQAQQLRVADAWLWNHQKTPNGNPDALETAHILEEVEKDNLFSSPKIDENSYIELKKYQENDSQSLSATEYFVDFVEETKDNVVIKGWAKFANRKASFLKSAVVIKEKQETYQIPTLFQMRYDVVIKQKSTDYLESGFLVFIPKKHFQNLSYILLSDNQKTGKIYLKYLILKQKNIAL